MFDLIVKLFTNSSIIIESYDVPPYQLSYKTSFSMFVAFFYIKVTYLMICICLALYRAHTNLI